jgi:hypothetical protein
MDDADNLLNASWGLGQAERLSTGKLNRLLEDNPVSTLWIVNQSCRIDETVKWRFTTSMPSLPADAALHAPLSGGQPISITWKPVSQTQL